jgi:glycosyltransferase involved in cell wall biosynthesis
VIYDLYPDALKQTGSLKKGSIVIRWITGFNKKLFLSAKSIITLSESMKTSILQYDVPEENIHFVHNWLINKDIKPREKQSNPFALKHNLADKKVVLYSGNMSLTHDLTSLVEAARILKDDKTVKFVFVGEGLKKKELVQKTQEYGLDNVLFLPYQRKDDFPFVISCADIGVVALGKGAEGVSVPSKTYSNLAAGLALLVIAPEGSELQRLIQNFDCGICCLPDNPQGVADQLRGLFNNENRLKRFQRNSFEASKNFTLENAKEYVRIINRNDD